MPERTALPCGPDGRAWYEADGVRVHFDCTLPGARGLCKLWTGGGFCWALRNQKKADLCSGGP